MSTFKPNASILGLAFLSLLSGYSVKADDTHVQPVDRAASAGNKEFQCAAGTKDSGIHPAMVVRWCEMWKDGRLLYHGPVWRWYPSGHMDGKENYVFGNADGLWPSWYENGNRSSLGNFKNGSKTGVWKYWDEQGHVSSEVTYGSNGYTTTEYYPSGRKKAVGSSNHDGKIGAWIYWAEDGSQKAQCDFGQGLFTLPDRKDCALISEELEPKGFSPPIPIGTKIRDNAVRLQIASFSYELSVPEKWVADTEAAKRDGLPVVFYPQGHKWKQAGSNMYLRVVYRNGDSFAKTIEGEKEEFESSVADYKETIQDSGRLGGTEYLLKTVSYKRMTATDSPFSIVSTKSTYETIEFLDVSKDFALMAVLVCTDEQCPKRDAPAMRSLVASLRSH